MDKALLRVLLPLLMLATVLAFVLALSPSSSGYAHDSVGATPNANHRSVPTASPLTPTPTAEAVSQPGSTDALVIMSIAIVLIIVLPILLQRALWAR